MTVCHLDSVESLCERTNLVNLDKDRVSSTHLDTLLQELHVGNEQVVAYELALVAYALCKFYPVLPVVLVETVLDRVDRILVDELLEVCNLLVCRELLTVRILLLTVLQLTIVVEPLTVLLNSELRSSAVHSDAYVLAWLVTSGLDSSHDSIQSILDTVEVRSETTLVTYSSRETASLQQLSEVVEYLSTHTYSLLDACSTNRTNHELLECDRSVRVCTTVNDVHHWERHCVAVATTDVAVQRDVKSLSSSLCCSQRNTEDSVSTELTLCRSTVECKHLLVNGTLVEDAVALESRSDDSIYILNSLQNALAEVTTLVAIAELESFVLTC